MLLITKIRNKLSYEFNRLFRRCFDHLSVKKGKIVFSNFNGRGFGDNPKYIALEILRQKLPMDLVWLVKDIDECVPNGIRKVVFGGNRMHYELATAQFIINNIKNDLPYTKRKKQYYIQTWHGTFALKYIEKEAEDKLSADYVLSSKNDSLKTDLLLCGCSVDYDIMRNSFWYSGEILSHGTPRNDIYFTDNNKLIAKVRKELDVPLNCNIALYAPTFRNDGDVSAYSLDAHKIIEALDNKTGNKWVVIIRLHPNVCKLSSIFEYTDRIIDGSSYPDPQELAVASNCLITDYSSIMYDFSIMKKPIFILAPDLEEYKKERGLRPIYYELPFSFCRSNEELQYAIMNFEENAYQKRLYRFWNEKVQVYDNGDASETVVQRIKDVMNGNYIK